MSSDFSNPLSSVTTNPSPATSAAGAAGNGLSPPRPITPITSLHRTDSPHLSRHMGLGRRTDSPNLTARVHDPAIEALKSHPILGTKYNLNVHSPKTFVSGYAFLWRGCSAKDLKEIAENKTASGIKVGAKKLPKITEEQAKKQVGEQGRFPEFSIEKSKVQGFGRGSLIALFKIKMEDLRAGSEAEAGWVCNTDTEVDIVAWHEGSQFEHPPTETFGNTPDRVARKLRLINLGRPATPTSVTRRNMVVLVQPNPNTASAAASSDAGIAANTDGAPVSVSTAALPLVISNTSVGQQFAQPAPIDVLHSESAAGAAPLTTASGGSLHSNRSMMSGTQTLRQVVPLSPTGGAMPVMPTVVTVNANPTNGHTPLGDTPTGCCGSSCAIL
jgi:hypothetical protein